MTKPAHYEACGIEPDEYCKANFTVEELRGAYRYMIEKYMGRYRRKDGVKDLHKAMDFLDWLIELEAKNG